MAYIVENSKKQTVKSTFIKLKIENLGTNTIKNVMYAGLGF